MFISKYKIYNQSWKASLSPPRVKFQKNNSDGNWSSLSETWHSRITIFSQHNLQWIQKLLWQPSMWRNEIDETSSGLFVIRKSVSKNWVTISRCPRSHLQNLIGKLSSQYLCCIKISNSYLFICLRNKPSRSALPLRVHHGYRLYGTKQKYFVP